MKIVKLILLVLTATGLMLVSQTVTARHAALLIDADNGNVLYELEANQSWYPASLTKLMTLYMAFSALESGRLSLKEHLNVSSHAARQPTSKLGLRTWDTISVEDAILSVVTRSANDSAVVLAERIGGSESQFALQMTSTAHSLGMYGSHFMNATGLPHDWQTTTAHDMALLALKIQRNFPQFYPYFAVDGFYHNGHKLHSTNKFVANYPGAEGMKTGYTCGSGFNLVASANQNGKRLIGVVLGGKTSQERYQHMYSMMDIGYSSENGMYSSKNINTMSGNAVGTPPYQLSCGHRPSSYHSAGIENEDEGHHVTYLRKSSIPHHYAASKSRSITKIRIAGKTKAIVRHSKETRHAAKSSKGASKVSKTTTKTVSKTKTAASKKTSNKTVKTASKSKTDKSVKTTKSVKSSAHGKGYYSPDKKTSATTKSKTVAKNSSKGKRNSKGKST